MYIYNASYILYEKKQIPIGLIENSLGIFAQVNKAILGVSGAIAYLHKLKIIHRDVK